MEIRDTRNGEWHWVYNALLADPHLTTGEKLVYSAISTFGGHQVIRPTKEQIASRCALDEKTVQRAIKRLEEVGYMSMDKSTGRGNANVYYLLKKPKGCNLCPFVKGDIEDHKGGHLEPERGAETTPHIDRYKDKKNPAIADSFDSEEIRTVEGEEDEPKKVTRSVKEYEEMVRWLEGTTGVKIINRSKQYAHLARARAAGINKTRLKQRVNDLLGEPFYKEHGLDFGGVVSSFDRKP